MKKNSFFSKSLWFYGLLLVLAGLGAYLLIYDMHYGPWAYSDSVEYIVSAKSLIAGKGLGIPAPDGSFLPLSLHPPFYSLLLVPFLALGLDAFDVIVGLNVLLFCLTLLTLGIGLYKTTRSGLLALTISALFLVSPAILRDFDGAMTEPLFIFLSLLNLFLLIKQIFQPSKWTYWGAVLCAALAMLTRYIGAVSIFSGFILLFFLPQKPRKEKITQSFGYALLSALPTAIWLISVSITSGSIASRSLQSGLSLGDALYTLRAAFMKVMVKWLPFRDIWFPTWKWKAYTVYLVIFVSAMMFLIIGWKWYRTRETEMTHPLALIFSAILYCGGYMGFLLVSLFSSLPPDLNERMMSPLQPLIWIIVFGSLVTLIQTYKLPKYVQIIPLALAVVLGISFWQQTRSLAMDRHFIGDGYAGPIWKNSETIRAAEQLPDDIPLISNEEAAVLLYTGNFPYVISELSLSQPLPAAGSFGNGESQEEEVFRNENAALILFWNSFNDQLKKVYGDQSEERLKQFIAGLTPYVETQDGGIYFYKTSSLPVK